MPPAAKTEEQFWKRFWSKVDKTGTCWLWLGARAAGYGSLKRDQRVLYAHRLVYEAKHGDIPDGLCVCHTCDNRACVRPSHFFLGTKADNNNDCAAKGRAIGGRAVARLSADAVQAIRSAYAAGTVSQRELAERFHVSQMTISKAVRRETWKRVS